GEKVFLFGTATDAETDPDSLLFHWEVTQVHNVHDHPNFFTADTRMAVFDVVEHGLPHEVNFLRAQLRVTDAGGLIDSTTHYIVLNRAGQSDITGEGTPIALVTAPIGAGNPDIGVIHDGVFPLAGSGDPLQQYDTDTGGGPRASDWIGYQFSGERYFSGVIFQEGIHSPAGGWWESMDVEVLDHGVWTPVVYRQVVPPYRGDDGVNFDIYTITFQAMAGTAIRLVGAPGGSDAFISAGELRVYEIPRADFSADVRTGTNPLVVQFTDLSSVPGATGWLWRFGDGATGTGQNVSHLYTVPGPHTVSLTVTADDAVYFEEKQRYVFVGTPGVTAEYFGDPNLSNPVLTRVDPAIDFAWGTGSPDASVPADSFSARWTGWVQAPFTEAMTLHTFTDDGVRLWVDGNLVIDRWVAQSPTEWTAVVPMVADRLYEITMEYFESAGGATAMLRWSSASQAIAVIPQSRLWARECGSGVGDMDGNGVLTPGDALCVFNTFLNDQTVPGGCDVANYDCEAAAADTDCNGTVTPADALAVYQHFLGGLPLEVCLGQGTLAPVAADGATPQVGMEIRDRGGTVEVALVVRDARTLHAIGFCVEYPAGFAFDALLPAPGTRDWLMAGAWSSNGTVFAGGFDTRGTHAGGTVEMMRVRLVRTDPDADAGAIRLVDLVDDLAGAVPIAAGGVPPGPAAYALHQNHPNPFNPQTSIRYDVPASAGRVAVRLAVYDVRGQLVRVLEDGARDPGAHVVTWDGRDTRGTQVTSGIYFYRLTAGDFRESRRMVLLK
ncbi:MAG: PA14 domain-containing protein, partial [Candidatus Krumholzibacteria bacterium]|nr:PA14 domain-containing protein [Candidatus Krumholzibacteria bacterium]